MRSMLPLNRGQNNKRCKGDLGSAKLPLILINKYPGGKTDAPMCPFSTLKQF